MCAQRPAGRVRSLSKRRNCPHGERFPMLTPQLSAHFPRRYNKCVSRPPPHLASPRESFRVITPNTAPIRLQPGTAASRCMQGPPLSPDVPGTAPDRLSRCMQGPPLSPKAPGTAPEVCLGWSASLDCRGSWVVLDWAAATRSAGRGCSHSTAWASGTRHRRGAARARWCTRSVACERLSTYTAAQAGC